MSKYPWKIVFDTKDLPQEAGLYLIDSLTEDNHEFINTLYVGQTINFYNRIHCDKKHPFWRATRGRAKDEVIVVNYLTLAALEESLIKELSPMLNVVHNG